MTLPTDLCALILTYTLNNYPKSIPEDIVRKAYKMEMKSRGLKTDEHDFQDFQARREILFCNDRDKSDRCIIFSRLNNIKYWESVCAMYTSLDSRTMVGPTFNIFKQHIDPVTGKMNVIHGDVIEHYIDKEIVARASAQGQYNFSYNVIMISYVYQGKLIDAIIDDMCKPECENKPMDDKCFALSRHLFEFLKEPAYFDEKYHNFLFERQITNIFGENDSSEFDNCCRIVVNVLNTHGIPLEF